MNMAEVMTLFDYNYWATARVLQAATNVSLDQFVGTPNGHTAGPRATLAHVLSVERLWRIRLETGLSPATMPAADFPDPAALQERWHAEEQAMRAYLSTLDATMLDAAIQFRRLSGELSASFTRWHLLMQCVTHGIAHRSEAATMLTASGQSPGDLDFFFFLLDRR
jgi:uncharacterized damage-inducible protein DinB